MLLLVDVACFSLLTFVSVYADTSYMKFHQNDYQIKFEWGEKVRYNSNLMNVVEVHVFKYNRTCTAANVTLEYKVPVENELELIIQAYKFASNEYRSFPLRLQVNFCNGLRNNYVGSRAIFACGNFTGCPIRKSVRYHFCNWIPDASQFPPFIPSGKYKLEAQALFHDQELYVINAYGEVFRPIKWE